MLTATCCQNMHMHHMHHPFTCTHAHVCTAHTRALDKTSHFTSTIGLWGQQTSFVAFRCGAVFFVQMQLSCSTRLLLTSC